MTAFSGQLGKETRQAGDFLTSADEVLFSSASPGLRKLLNPFLRNWAKGQGRSRSLLVILFFSSDILSGVRLPCNTFVCICLCVFFHAYKANSNDVGTSQNWKSKNQDGRERRGQKTNRIQISAPLSMNSAMTTSIPKQALQARESLLRLHGHRLRVPAYVFGNCVWSKPATSLERPKILAPARVKTEPVKAAASSPGA